MDPVKQIEHTIQELDANIDTIPENEDIKSFLKDFYRSPTLLYTAMEAVPGPSPPPFVPPLPVFNVYPQTVGNLNNANALDTAMKAAPTPPSPPPPGVPAQPVFNSYPQTVGNWNTADAVYMEAAPPPPPGVPTQPVFNSYPQTVGNWNTADAVYMEAAPPPPPGVPAQPVFNSYPQTVGNWNTANAMFMESAPAPPMQLMAPPSFHSQGAPTVYSQAAPSVYIQSAPSVYSQSAPSVYSQSAPSVYSQGAPVFHQSYGQHTMQPGGHLYSQAVAHSQAQYLSYQQQAFNHQRASCIPPQQYMQMWMPGQDMNLPVVGVLNGEVVYGITPGANLMSFSGPTKKKKQLKHEDQQPYVRRPPNAFMLYLKEQRPHVMTEVKSLTQDTINSATVNAILGQRWKSLTKEEQDKYYNEANRQREYHYLLHPGWSPGQNYGKKRKRIRKKAPKMTESVAASAFEATAVEVQQVPMHPQLMGPPISPVPPVTVPHVFSLHPQPFNPDPPQH